MYSSNLWNSVVMVRVSRYGTGARGTWQRLSFTYFASISPSNFSWHSSLSLVRSMHSFNWCCMFPFVIIFKKISIQKENTCYSITIGEQDYSQENSCVAVSFSKGCRTSALNFIKKTPTKVVSCEIWTPFLQNTSSGCLCIYWYVETPPQLFSCEFWKILKNIIDHLRWLRLSVTRC